MPGVHGSRAREAAHTAIRAAIAELGKTDSERARSLKELMENELSAGYGR